MDAWWHYLVAMPTQVTPFIMPCFMHQTSTVTRRCVCCDCDGMFQTLRSAWNQPEGETSVRACTPLSMTALLPRIVFTAASVPVYGVPD